jgi:RNA polymerase sigma-54 factor
VEPTSLFRTALDDARGELTPAEQAIGEYILGSLDDRGFLSCGLDEAARALGVAADRLAYVLHVLRGTGSPALGACDVRESLLLQLAHLEETGATYPLVRSLVADHLEALLRRGPSAVAASLGVTPADVHSALAFMRTHLRPIAAEVEPEPWARPAQAARQWPDVAIRVPEDPRLPVEVEVLGPGELCIDPTYRLASALTPNRHVLEFTRRAETFITLLQRRADVLRRIVARAANEQRAQVAGRGQPLGPRLTRAELARELGLHESTVTRAVANKLALLPDGRLQPLSEFFEQRHAVQDALRKLIGTETLPLTDAQLATHLATLGYRVARRTVAKYREALGIPAITVRS